MADQNNTLKRYIYKVYTHANVYLGDWNDVITDFNYSQELNKAGAAVELEIARTSDSVSQTFSDRQTVDGLPRFTYDGRTRSSALQSRFVVGSDSNIDLNYNIEVYVVFGQLVDRQTVDGTTRFTYDGRTRTAADGSPTGRKIFTGYISKFVSSYGSKETTTVTILSHGVELNQYLLENGTATALTYSSQDPTNILKDILDKFTAAGGLVDYDSSSTDLTGTTVSYVFKADTILDAIDHCLSLAPTDWYWYIDMANNILYFRNRPVDVSHRFLLGKHIENFALEKHIENLINVVYFSGGPTAGINLFNKYSDATSIAAYRRSIARISDNRVTIDASAQIISESMINRYKDPIYRSEITILDRDYPIEEIQLGQLIGFSNFGNFVDQVTMQVVAKRYFPDKVTLQLDTLLPSVSKRVEDVKRNLDNLNTLDNPSVP
jgi:YD repeat-containing protein